MAERSLCKLCGEPMPCGEEMFNYHGYSGPCPKKHGVASEPAPTPPVWDECVGSHDEAEPAVERPTEPPYETEYELARRIRELESELSSLRQELKAKENDLMRREAEFEWDCPKCGFAMNKVHFDEAESEPCPVCSESELRARVEELKAALNRIFLCWSIFHAKLPNGEYDGLGETRTALIAAKALLGTEEGNR